MFRSPLWEHPVQPTDFLLLRQSDGRWTVRRLQGTAVRARAARTTVASAPPDVRRALAPPHTQVAGHQEPFESGLVHPPGARENADYLDRLVQVVAYRLFRDKMEALERERRGDEDALVFDADFRSVLGRDFDMERLKGHLKEMTTARRGSFALADDEEIPSEEVLREKLTPEMARARPRPRAAARAQIQGTDADMRRLTKPEAAQVLINLGLKEEEIRPLGRRARAAAPPVHAGEADAAVSINGGCPAARQVAARAQDPRAVRAGRQDGPPGDQGGGERRVTLPAAGAPHGRSGSGPAPPGRDAHEAPHGAAAGVRRGGVAGLRRERRQRGRRQRQRGLLQGA